MTPLERLRRYVAMRDARPMTGIGDTIHAIHTGSEWEAELSLDDLRAVLAMVPAEPSEVIPEPAVGQVWKAPGAKFGRRIFGIVINYNNGPYDETDTLGRWNEWVARTGARPVTP